MKKLGKLSINPEKVIKNEELVNLRGGDYGSGFFRCCCGMGPMDPDDCWMEEAADCNDAIQRMIIKCSFGGGCFCT